MGFKEQKKAISIFTKAIIALAIAVVYMFLTYSILWVNAYPALLKGYIPFVAVLVIVFCIISYIFFVLVKMFLGSNVIKSVAKEVKKESE